MKWKPPAAEVFVFHLNDRALWRRIYAVMIFIDTPKSDDGRALPDTLRASYSCDAADALIDELEKREGLES